MQFLKDDDKKAIQNALSNMDQPVKLVFFTQELECMLCKETEQLLKELVELSDKLSLEVYNFQLDKDKAEEYKIDKVPALAVIGEKDYGIRFFGIPSGYEFASLLEDIVDVSRARHGFTEDQLNLIDSVQEETHIQVFVTPSCPYCPSAVRAAHRLAIANDNIRADMIEVSEFPQLGQRYNVRGVPRSVINEKWSLEGAVPDDLFIAKLLESTGVSVA